jgi:hypothetical protein
MSSWYGAAVGDFVEGEQRLQQGLINTRLDELALASDPPRARRRGVFSHPSAMHYRPGMVDQLDKPKEDLILHMPTGITQNNYVEFQLSEGRAARRMGVSDVALQGGAARPAATRTAAGVALQQAGSSNRLFLPIRRLERFLIAPLLYKTAALIAKHDTEAGVGLFIDKQGRRLGPVEPGAMKKRARFRLHGATKAMSQAKQQAVLPIVLQTYMAGPFVQAQAAIGRTTDFEQLDRFVMEATGTMGAYTFTRPMTEEEQQAKNQPPAEAMMKMQLAQQSNETRLQMGQLKAQTDTQIQAEKSAVEILKQVIGEKNVDRKLRADAVRALAQIEAARVKGRDSGGA